MFLPTRHVVLKFVESGEGPLTECHDLFKNLDLSRAQRFQLPVVVMNNPHRARQTKSHRAVRNLQGVFRIFHAAPEH